MSERESDRLTAGQLFEEAAAWFAHMRGPDAESSRVAFNEWLSRGALHRSAYNRAAEIFAMGKVLADEPIATYSQLGRRNKKSRMLAISAIGAAAVATIWLTFRPANVMITSAARHNRGIAETAQLTAPAGSRLVRLIDGSLVRLERGSHVGVTYDASSRRLTLDDGAARFKVAHEARPFVVYAGGGAVTAHGTLFDVSLSQDRHVSVRLIDGVVDVKIPVSNTGARGAIVRRLHRGGSVRFAVSNMVPDTPAAMINHHSFSAANNEGDHDYDSIRVADLIAAANRQSVRPIQLEDRSIGERRISGRFRIDDPDLLAERLAPLFGLVVDRSEPALIILKRP